MSSTRKTAMVTGVLFVITFVASIPAQFIFYEPVLKHSGYILGAGADTRIAMGALLEIITVIANVGTAVVLFSVLKRQSERFAIGYVAARIMECALIVIGILSLLTVVTLRQGAAASGADRASLVMAGTSLVALHDWTFLLGPGFVTGLGTGLILGYLMYRSELVPRWMAMLGLIGGPLIVLSGIAVLFGVIDAGSLTQGVATIPEFFWELGLGIYLIVKGFRPEAVARLYPAPVVPGREPVAV
jgi:hypothetical protein